ncbi:alpha/beta fold hydrolase [Anaerostipes butyraticus]|uniref:alpha/beta fold hydrolase n=1 Tax=Anaerostipes butyraticus TaxID=645466 RepID=UPI00320980A8
MKTIFLHGLGQTADDWRAVIQQASLSDIDCPELFSLPEGDMSYSEILKKLEKRYEKETETFCICGLSLGGLLALDYTIRHRNKVDSLVLIGAQYKVPTRMIDFQNFIFRCMPKKAFDNMGMSKKDAIQLSHSMRTLDFSAGLKDIMCPVIIICGEKDTVPQAELHIVPGAGHEINKEAPEAIAAIL